MPPTADHDHAYSLLVALCDDDRVVPTADLMAAFNEFAASHTPHGLMDVTGRSYDELLDDVSDLVLRLAASATDVRAQTRLHTVASLVTSVILQRRADG